MMEFDDIALDNYFTVIIDDITGKSTWRCQCGGVITTRAYRGTHLKTRRCVEARAQLLVSQNQWEADFGGQIQSDHDDLLGMPF